MPARAGTLSCRCPGPVRRAVTYLHDNLGQRITLPDIARASGVAERTLHKQFRRFLGISPVQYLHQARLAKARDELLKADSKGVSGIATRLAFQHLGRFAVDYRERFGEPPSVTYERARATQNELASPLVQMVGYTRPSLLLLPFRTETAQERIWAAAILERIAAALAQTDAADVRLLSEARARELQADPRGVCQHYRLHGRLRQLNDRIRVVVRLTDAATDRQLWGDCSDGTAQGLFEMEDDVVNGVLHAIHPSIIADQIGRAERKDPDAFCARDITLRALTEVLSWKRSTRPLEPLYLAMELDPRYALPVALAAWCHVRLSTPWNPDAAKERAQARVLAERAAVLAPDDSWVLSLRAGIAHSAEEFDDADILSTRALARDPYHAWALNRRGWVHEAHNRWDDAIPYFARIEHIKPPYFDDAESATGIGTAHFAARRYDLAEMWLRKASLVRPDGPCIHAALASCYLQLGDRSAARRAAAVVRRVVPDITTAEFLASYPCPSVPFKEALANGLVEACMPP